MKQITMEMKNLDQKVTGTFPNSNYRHDEVLERESRDYISQLSAGCIHPERFGNSCNFDSSIVTSMYSYVERGIETIEGLGILESSLSSELLTLNHYKQLEF